MAGDSARSQNESFPQRRKVRPNDESGAVGCALLRSDWEITEVAADSPVGRV
jgi:hypothetical protein